MPQDETLGEGQGIGRSHKAGKEASFEKLFKKTLEEINEAYIGGTLDHIRRYHRDFHQSLVSTEDRLNELWKAGREGRATLDEFKELLKEWLLLHLKAIDLHKVAIEKDKKGRVPRGFF